MHTSLESLWWRLHRDSGCDVLGVLNAFVRPILFVLTLPITIITLGLFTFIINALLFWFAASFLEGFAVANFWYALLGSVLMSLVATISSKLVD